MDEPISENMLQKLQFQKMHLWKKEKYFLFLSRDKKSFFFFSALKISPFASKKKTSWKNVLEPIL